MVVPFLCFVAALVLLWNSFIGWTQVSVMLVMYVLTGLGVTVGFHRLFTHRSFDTSRPVRYLFAVLGSMAVQGPVITGWPTTASTTRSPTRRATRTARTPPRRRAWSARSRGYGTRTSAGCSRAQGTAEKRASRPT